MLACGAGAVVAIRRDTASVAPWIGAAAVVGFMLAALVAGVSERVTLEASAGTLTPSWRPAIRPSAPIQLGTWVAPGLDTAIGVVIHVRGEGGMLRIGIEGHDGLGYDLRGPPVRSVDCRVATSELRGLAEALGIQRGESRAPRALAVPLVRNARSFGNVMLALVPWFVTLAAAITIGISGRDLLATRDGQLATTGVLVAITLGSIAVMVIRSRRIRRPSLELRIEPDALVLVRRDGREVLRAAWTEVSAQGWRYEPSSRTGSHAIPLLVLRVGQGAVLRLGAWDTRLAWPDDPERTWRGPSWLVGAPHWPHLVEALRTHRVLPSAT